MYTRKLIDFLFPDKQQPEPRPNAGIPADAEFAWPPSAEDMEALSVVDLRRDDGSDSGSISEVV